MRVTDGKALLFLLLIAALPVLGYQYGYGNQVEQFSLVGRLGDPAFLKGDFYVDSAAQFGPRYYYSLILSWLTKIAPLPAIILALTCLTNFALAAVSFDTARRHLDDGRMAGPLAALMVIVNSSFALGFAGYLHFESYQPANPAIAFALGGFALLLAGRRLWAAPAFALAAVMHPLIGVETAAIAFGACALGEAVAHRKPAPILRAWIGYIPSGLIFGAAVFAAWVWPQLGQNAVKIPDAEFFHILAEVRAPHHYLARAMANEQFLRAGLFVLAFAGMAAMHVKEKGLRFGAAALAAAGLIVLGLCAASVVLVDVMHNRAATTAQIFRMLMVLKWVGLLFFAARAATWLKTPNLLTIPAAIAPFVVTGEAQPYVLLASVALVETSRLLKLKSAFQAVFAVAILALSWHYQRALGEWTDFGRAVIGVGLLAAVYGLGEKLIVRLAAVAALAGCIAFGVANRDLGHDFKVDIFESNYGLGDLKTPASDVGRWAKAHTPKDSVFVTPPDFEAFRLTAERPIVADFTSLPFGDLSMRQWHERMVDLYGPVEGGGFQALRAMRDAYRTGATVPAAAAKYGAAYAVLYRETPWIGPVLYENVEFKVVKTGGTAP